jgi:hypothetical protein
MRLVISDKADCGRVRAALSIVEEFSARRFCPAEAGHYVPAVTEAGHYQEVAIRREGT